MAHKLDAWNRMFNIAGGTEVGYRMQHQEANSCKWPNLAGAEEVRQPGEEQSDQKIRLRAGAAAPGLGLCRLKRENMETELMFAPLGSLGRRFDSGIPSLALWRSHN